jgi:citrate lyase subunit beta / citryl-CoA lyase
MSKLKKASAGQKGPKVRSDCYIEIEDRKSGGIKLNLKSKVQAMYGNQIEDQIFNLCRHFVLRHAVITVEDAGALPFTISARFELALKRIHPELECEFLPEFNPKNKYKTKKDNLRRSRLYLPGNEPKFYPNAGLHKPDGIILDLEDSVAPTEKDAAQLIVRNALRSIDFYGAERMVRINQIPQGLGDLEFIVPNNVHVILIPKVESKDEIEQVEYKVLELKKKHKIRNDIYFMPIIESALGVEKAFEIASASKYNCSLAVGLEDYTADIGTQRSNEGTESFVARSKVVNAAKAAGIQAIDTVFSDVNDMAALEESAFEAKQLGFEGKGCIHPRQVGIINKAFLPTDEEIEKAKKIVLAFEEAKIKGIGVVSIGSKMIDAPIVKRAERIIKMAVENSILSPNWNKQ